MVANSVELDQVQACIVGCPLLVSQKPPCIVSLVANQSILSIAGLRSDEGWVADGEWPNLELERNRPGCATPYV